MKVEKDGIKKDVEENIVSDYISSGWNLYKEPKKESKSKKSEEKERIDGE